MLGTHSKPQVRSGVLWATRQYIISERTFTARKNEDDKWEFDNDQMFRGYGQIESDLINLNLRLLEP